jgi:flavin reductase (DIM6/NTAB) family NADH-FMN oxidoreductase RutF
VPGDLLTDEDLPVVAEAATTLRGRVSRIHDGGDHRIVVVAIDAASVASGELPPLLYWRRGYRKLTADS